MTSRLSRSVPEVVNDRTIAKLMLPVRSQPAVCQVELNKITAPRTLLREGYRILFLAAEWQADSHRHGPLRRAHRSAGAVPAAVYTVQGN